MFRVELRGSYADMGRQQALPRDVWSPPPPDPKVLCFAKQCEEHLALHGPELLEEMRGFAEASGIDYDTFLTFVTTTPFDPDEMRACTVVAVLPERTVDGRTIVGRNFDFFHDVSEQGATTYLTYPDERHASAGNCDIWVGREDGINEAGLFFGQAAIFMPGLQPGLTFWYIGRLLLDRCATVDEGIELLYRVPHAASWTYLLADARGNAAVVEPTIEGIEVRYPEDGLLILTNHAVCPRWAGREAFVPPDSHPRYERLRAFLGGSHAITVDTVKAAMRDHEGLVCSHGAHFPDRKFGTLWSVVGQPGERMLHVAAGYPCEAEYEAIGF
ncbi:MAG: hypothetical protein JXA93_24195 [Anaerolineae bacterium]|nr:hypothetical protein [Anaerolineae bacterium]